MRWCCSPWTFLFSTFRPGGRLLFRFFLDPNNLTRENTFSLLGFSFVPLLLLGLPLPRQAFAFSRSLACRFWRIRELAIAAARDMFPRWSETKLCVPDGGRDGGFADKAVGVCGVRRGGLHHPRLSSHHTPTAAVSQISVILKSGQNPPSVRPGASWKSLNKSRNLPVSER